MEGWLTLESVFTVLPLAASYFLAERGILVRKCDCGGESCIAGARGGHKSPGSPRPGRHCRSCSAPSTYWLLPGVTNQQTTAGLRGLGGVGGVGGDTRGYQLSMVVNSNVPTQLGINLICSRSVRERHRKSIQTMCSVMILYQVLCENVDEQSSRLGRPAPV